MVVPFLKGQFRALPKPFYQSKSQCYIFIVPEYIELNILSVKRLYNYNTAFLMYKHSNDMLPSLFDDFFL